MKNKILMLPISGGAGNAATINQCQDSTETLMDTTLKQFQDGMEPLMDAANGLPADLLIDTGVSGASAANWKRYKQIVRGTFAADNDGWGLLTIQYQQEPSMVQDFASVTIMFQNDRLFTPCAMAALAMATVLADEITTTTDDGNAQICFTVRDIHYATSSFEY